VKKEAAIEEEYDSSDYEWYSSRSISKSQSRVNPPFIIWL
jgi:hypothetical protein